MTSGYVHQAARAVLFAHFVAERLHLAKEVRQ